MSVLTRITDDQKSLIVISALVQHLGAFLLWRLISPDMEFGTPSASNPQSGVALLAISFEVTFQCRNKIPSTIVKRNQTNTSHVRMATQTNPVQDFILVKGRRMVGRKSMDKLMNYLTGECQKLRRGALQGKILLKCHQSPPLRKINRLASE